MKYLRLTLGLALPLLAISCSRGQDVAQTSNTNAYEKPNATFAISKSELEDRSFFEDAYLVNVNFEADNYKLYSQVLKVSTKEVSETKKIQLDGQVAYVVTGIQFALEGKFLPDQPIRAAADTDDETSKKLSQTEIEKLVEENGRTCSSIGFSLSQTRISAYCDYELTASKKTGESELEGETESQSEDNSDSAEEKSGDETDTKPKGAQGEDSQSSDAEKNTDSEQDSAEETDSFF